MFIMSIENNVTFSVKKENVKYNMYPSSLIAGIAIFKEINYILLRSFGDWRCCRR